MSSVISRISITAVCLSTLLGASDKPLKVAAANLYANTRNHTVLHDKDGFSVNGQRVSDVDVSKDLRGISAGALKRLFEKDKALHVQRTCDGYKINSTERLKAGGAFGAWLGGCIGYGSVHGISQGLVALVCTPVYIVNPALGYAVNCGMGAVVGALIQPVAITAAVGGAIGGAVITGPV